MCDRRQIAVFSPEIVRLDAVISTTEYVQGQEIETSCITESRNGWKEKYKIYWLLPACRARTSQPDRKDFREINLRQCQHASPSPLEMYDHLSFKHDLIGYTDVLFLSLVLFFLSLFLLGNVNPVPSARAKKIYAVLIRNR